MPQFDLTEYVVDVKAWAKIGVFPPDLAGPVLPGVDDLIDPAQPEVQEYEIGLLRVVYGVNSIPQLKIGLVVGQVADPAILKGAPQFNNLFELTQTLQQSQQIEVWINTKFGVDGDAKEKGGLANNKDMRLFRGRIRGLQKNTVVTTSGGTMALVVDAEGDLALLNNATTNNKLFVKADNLNGPADPSKAFTNESEFDSLRKFDYITTAQKIDVHDGDIFEQYRTIIRAITKTYDLKTGTIVTDNLEYLDKMVSDPKINFHNELIDHSKKFFDGDYRKMVSNAFFPGGNHTATPLSALLRLAQIQGFALIPCIDRAYYVPIQPMMGAANNDFVPYKTVKLADYHIGNMSIAFNDNIGGVVIYPTKRVDIFSGNATPISYKNIWWSAWYDATNALSQKYHGSDMCMKLEPTPPYLLYDFPVKAQKNDAVKIGIPEVVNNKEKVKAREGDDKSGQSWGAEYCKYRFLQKLMANRAMTITGRLRLDISPGSFIKLETLGERQQGADFVGPENIPTLYAFVSSVIINITGGFDNPSASTTLSLQYVRTAAEFNDVALSATQHHMVNGKMFTGAKLTNDV